MVLTLEIGIVLICGAVWSVFYTVHVHRMTKVESKKGEWLILDFTHH